VLWLIYLMLARKCFRSAISGRFLRPPKAGAGLINLRQPSAPGKRSYGRPGFTLFNAPYCGMCLSAGSVRRSLPRPDANRAIPRRWRIGWESAVETSESDASNASLEPEAPGPFFICRKFFLERRCSQLIDNACLRYL
jgi:hypothetical protein